MDSNYTRLNRLLQIYRQLSSKPYTTKEELIDILIDKFGNASERTLSRDISDLRRDFNLVIEFKRNQGYYLDTESYQDTSRIRTLMHLADSIFFKLRFSNNDKYIEADVLPGARGTEYLDNIYEAIESSVEISFDYQKFNSDQRTHRVVIPLFLKEYKQRWYIYAYTENDFRVFGLDRIYNLKVLDKKVKKPKFDRKVFDKVVGISKFYGTPEKIKLKLHIDQLDYLQTVPIHHSQKIIELTEDYFVIELFVVKNYELEEIIRGLGEKILK